MHTLCQFNYNRLKKYREHFLKYRLISHDAIVIIDAANYIKGKIIVKVVPTNICL